MAKKQNKGRYHPSRRSQKSKMSMKRQYDQLHQTAPKSLLKPININQPNWSLTK